MAKNQGFIGFIKDFYNDPFKWSLVKSFGFFVVGVGIANELTGLEPMSAIPQ